MPESSVPQPPVDAMESIPAATVVIFRRAQAGAPELLMVQRSRALRFAGGAAVFPGGKVDPADVTLAATLMPDEPLEIASARIAAIRETLEETGLVLGLRERISVEQAIAARAMLIERGELAPVLDAFGWNLEPEQLTLYAHWCRPARRSYDTRFFIADLGTGAVDIAVDATENTHLFWITAADALEQIPTGEMSAIYPTVRNLERLAQFATFEATLADIERHPVRRILPWEIERDGETWITIPEGCGYPVLSAPLASSRRA